MIWMSCACAWAAVSAMMQSFFAGGELGVHFLQNFFALGNGRRDFAELGEASLRGCQVV